MKNKDPDINHELEMNRSIRNIRNNPMKFCNDIARVRTKAELQAAIFQVLEKTMHIQLGMIQIIEEDGFILYPFMYDSTLCDWAKSKSFFDEMMAKCVTVNKYYIILPKYLPAVKA